MRELFNINSNLILVQDENTGLWCTQAELTFIATAPHYHLDQDSFLKTGVPVCDTFRVFASEKMITKMIEGLERLRFDMQSAETAVNAANSERTV